jgi:hypothetical protein
MKREIALAHRVAQKARALVVLIDPAPRVRLAPNLALIDPAPRVRLAPNLALTDPVRLPRVGRVRQQAIAHRVLVVLANLRAIEQN